ncbi:hypothetical protein PENTCL1PPCAC_12902 [Pristionchus entomophagus]|uniref:Uncharacterized protein n=1 Tax=Pristionchus entomophagus TaxID=358040 RepID=A0AAV5T705_9BILA|nr:hypothetical protein PENTCL1PPCAC_12902 [Pristionchus entomophagus]
MHRRQRTLPIMMSWLQNARSAILRAGRRVRARSAGPDDVRPTWWWTLGTGRGRPSPPCDY